MKRRLFVLSAAAFLSVSLAAWPAAAAQHRGGRVTGGARAQAHAGGGYAQRGHGGQGGHIGGHIVGGHGGYWLGPGYGAGFYGPSWYGDFGWAPWGAYIGPGVYGPGAYGPAYGFNDEAGAVKLKVRGVDAKLAQVSVDGAYAGTVDDFDGVFQQLDLQPGPHRIDVSAPGFQPLSFEVNIEPGKTITYRGTLQPAP